MIRPFTNFERAGFRSGSWSCRVGFARYSWYILKSYSCMCVSERGLRVKLPVVRSGSITGRGMDHMVLLPLRTAWHLSTVHMHHHMVLTSGRRPATRTTGPPDARPRAATGRVFTMLQYGYVCIFTANVAPGRSDGKGLSLRCVLSKNERRFNSHLHSSRRAQGAACTLRAPHRRRAEHLLARRRPRLRCA